MPRRLFVKLKKKKRRDVQLFEWGKKGGEEGRKERKKEE